MINTLLGEFFPVVVPAAIKHVLVVCSMQLLFRLMFEERSLSYHRQRGLERNDLATGFREKSAPPRAEPRAEVATGCSEYVRGIERRSGSKTCLPVSVFVSTGRRERRGCIPGFGWISKKITATWRVDFIDIWYYSDGGL